ncbi:MAG: peptidylprolyl isomerase [Candidatus Eiseniibacteriota bacterium]|nr:MAG: peptidylprolyl isomerase [Candidatus Eisenbacteria bacterium]
MRRRHVLAPFILFLILLAGLTVACGSQEEVKEQPKQETAKEEVASTKEAAPKDTAKAPTGEEGKKVDEVAILETNHGTIVLEFFPDIAPGHVENFKKLAKKGFYDGTTFHRVIKGFMIQGGDPLTKDSNPDNDGTGDPGYRIKAEFSDTKHLKGTLSMARGQDPNSAGCQFFICLDAHPSLDGKYTVFGQVLDGIKVVEAIGNVKIKANRFGEQSVPVEPVVLKKASVVSRAKFEEAKKAKKTEPEEGTGK